MMLFQKMQKKIDNVNRVVQENLIGIRVVKAYVREEKEKEKFHLSSDELAAQGVEVHALHADLGLFAADVVEVVVVTIG